MNFFASLTLGAAFLALPTLARAADVGVVALVQNDVRLQMPGQTKARPVSAMQNLPEGSLLKVGATGRAVVVIYADGSRFSLPAGSVATFSAAGLKSQSGAAPTRLPDLKLQQAKVLRGSRIAYGRSASTVMRRVKTFELRSLIFGATMDSRPTFRWTAMPGAITYTLSLLDDNDQPIFEREVKGTSLVYPLDAPALKPEIDYAWSISAQAHDQSVIKEGTFRVLAPERIKQVQDDLSALETGATDDDGVLNGVLRAEIFRKYDLLDDAAGVYEQLTAKNPNSVALHLAYAELLSSQNRLDESAVQSSVAETLQKADN